MRQWWQSWHGACPSRQISIKQNRHRFWEQRVKEALHSNKKLFLIFSGVFLPTVSESQEQETSVHYSHPPSNLSSSKIQLLFSPFLTKQWYCTHPIGHLTKKNKRGHSFLFSFCLFFIWKKQQYQINSRRWLYFFLTSGSLLLFLASC